MTLVDDDLDPMELEDHKELEEDDTVDAHTEEPGVNAHVSTLHDPESELIADLDKLSVPEVSPKKSAQMLSQDLIEKELEPEDLCDAGCI